MRLHVIVSGAFPLSQRGPSELAARQRCQRGLLLDCEELMNTHTVSLFSSAIPWKDAGSA